MSHCKKNDFSINNICEITEDFEEIVKHIDRVTSLGQQTISIDYEDFKLFPKLYMSIDILDINKFEPNYPELDFEVQSVIICLSSKLNMSLFKVDKIIESFMNYYGHEIIWMIGTTILNIDGIHVDIFMFNKTFAQQDKIKISY